MEAAVGSLGDGEAVGVPEVVSLDEADTDVDPLGDVLGELDALDDCVGELL